MTLTFNKLLQSIFNRALHCDRTLQSAELAFMDPARNTELYIFFINILLDYITKNSAQNIPKEAFIGY